MFVNKASVFIFGKQSNLICFSQLNPTKFWYLKDSTMKILIH